MRTSAVLLALSLPTLLAGCNETGLRPVPDPDGGGQGDPRILVEPGSLAFDAVGVGCDTDRLVRVTNVGSGTLEVEVPTVGGEDAGDFDPEQVVTFDLEQSENRTFSVVFTAGDEGPRRGSLAVASNDPKRPEVEVPLAGEGDNDEHIRTDDFATTGSLVDVLFIIDNSGSMSPKQADVAENVAGFFQWFRELELDFHMGVITTDIVADDHRGRLQGSPAYLTSDTPDAESRLAEAVAVGEDDMGDESGLAAMELALSEPVRSEDNAGFYRDDAFLSVIVLSDEPEQSSRGSAHYIDFLRGLKSDPAMIGVSAIVGDRGDGCFGQCGGMPTDAMAGDAYIDVQEAFPGVFQSICGCDYRAAMEAVGGASTGTQTEFPLSRVPLDAERIEVEIDGETTDAFTYSADANLVEVDPAALPDGAATVYVRYPVEGPCGG